MPGICSRVCPQERLCKGACTLNGPSDPVSIGAVGESLGNELVAQMKLVADDVTVIVFPDTGHWIMEEKPKETTDALVKFL